MSDIQTGSNQGTVQSAGSASTPRVALVHDWLTGMRGGEKVLEVIAGLYPAAPIFTLFHFPGRVSKALEAHPIHTSWLQRAPFLRRHYRRYLPFFPAAIEDFDLDSFDLVISTSHCVAKGVVPAPGAVHVCYCHTPMRYAWDQEHAYFPKRHGLVARLRGLVLSRLRTWDVASSARTDHFLANSTFVAERIRRYYGRDAEVVPPPVDLDSFAPGQALETQVEPSPSGASRFALSVAALAPYKRHEIAIAACRSIELPLVIVGEGPERSRLERLGGDGIRFAGRVPAGELSDLFRRAAVFVQPGIEDFGIAAVESLASGTPVAAAGAGGVLDIVEHGVHGALYDPARGVEGLAESIDKAIGLRSNSLDLRRRAEQFSTPSFVARFRSSLRTVADRSSAAADSVSRGQFSGSRRH